MKTYSEASGEAAFAKLSESVLIPTPSVLVVIKLAAVLAKADGDTCVRLAHLQMALNAQPTTEYTAPRARRGKTCPRCNAWFGWQRHFNHHMRGCRVKPQPSTAEAQP